MSNELARREPENALAVAGEQWQAMKEQAGYLVKSGFLPPALKTAEQVIAVALQGRECRMGPMASVRHINIIQGKPTMSAEGMLALCFRDLPGFKAEPIEDTDKAFAIKITRRGQQPYVSRFSMDDADRAGLLKKGGSWSTYPKAMLRARAISAGCRLICPDVLMGVSYTPEELGADVDEDGEVLEGQIVQEPQPEPEAQPKPDPEPAATITIGQAAKEKAGSDPIGAGVLSFEEEAARKTMCDAIQDRRRDLRLSKEKFAEAIVDVHGSGVELMSMTRPELKKLYELIPIKSNPEAEKAKVQPDDAGLAEE